MHVYIYIHTHTQTCIHICYCLLKLPASFEKSAHTKGRWARRLKVCFSGTGKSEPQAGLKAELLQTFGTLLIIADCPAAFASQPTLSVIQTNVFCFLVKERLVSGWELLRPVSHSQRELWIDTSGRSNLQYILSLLREWQPEIQLPTPCFDY